MAKPVEYDTLVIASLYSGVLMVDDFGKMHQAAEDLMGCPVMTHQLPRVIDQLQPYIADFCPEVAAFDYSEVDHATARQKGAELVSEAGAFQTLRTPLLKDQKFDPLDDLPRGIPVINLDPRKLRK